MNQHEFTIIIQFSDDDDDDDVSNGDNGSWKALNVGKLIRNFSFVVVAAAIVDFVVVGLTSDGQTLSDC